VGSGAKPDLSLRSWYFPANDELAGSTGFPRADGTCFPKRVPSAATTERSDFEMIEFSFFWCVALCALAIESARSVAVMHKLAMASLARFDQPGGNGSRELFHHQIEQAGPWTELLTSADVSETAKQADPPLRQSKLNISLGTPWLFLSLLLLFWLLLL
jgi:hypothetical protein